MLVKGFEAWMVAPHLRLPIALPASDMEYGSGQAWLLINILSPSPSPAVLGDSTAPPHEDRHSQETSLAKCMQAEVTCVHSR